MALTDEIEKLVGSINGAFSTISHAPVQFLHRKNPSWEESVALFAIADCLLVTSLRDGMNLTSHEFAVFAFFLTMI